MTESAFWARFYDHELDRRMNWTAITKVLRKERKETNEETADDLRAELGDTFDSQVSYRGKTLTRTSAIAKRAHAHAMNEN
jgi:hypothetical protein